MLLFIRLILLLLWLLKILVLMAIVGSVISVGMILINYFGTHEYGGLDFQMNLVTEMIGVWASTGVTVLVVDRLYANREREKENQRLRHDVATGDNEIAKRAVDDLRYKELLAGKKGILTRAYLTGAELQDADLHGANLERTVLHSANLEGANLMNADLRNSKLGMANLRKSQLFGAYIVGAEVEGADPVELDSIAKIARAKDLALGTDFEQFLTLDESLLKLQQQMKELDEENNNLIVEWDAMIIEAREQIDRAQKLSNPPTTLVEENEAAIMHWSQQILETQKLRQTNQASMERNEQDRQAIVNFTLYGQERPIAEIERAILPDGTLFTSEMQVSYLQKFTDPQHEEFDKTLQKINSIRRAMGYSTRRTFAKR